MGDERETVPQESAAFSWAVVTALSLGVLLWGLFIFWTVREPPPPSWDFGAVQDIPGQSPYSTWTPRSKAFPGTVPHPEAAGRRVDQQHVDGGEPKLPLPGGTREGAR